ncbi:MAG: phage head closure protein [Bacillota bacterium]|jgi:SPP1 family predicted phage head-tail adaptor
MKIGDLRHRVTLQQKTVIEDDLKQHTENWTDIATVWARIEPLSGREYFAARQENTEVTTRITIRYLPGITTDSRVVFGGRVFEVLSAIDPEERCESLILMCNEVPV